MDFETVKLHILDHVAHVIMNRPEKRNAFNSQMVIDLSRAFEILRDHSCRSIVLTGEGQAFSAGADLEYMSKMKAASREENVADAENLANLLRIIYTHPKPVVAQVNGAAIGGGVGLIAACDIAVAKTGSFFAFSEVRLGLTPAVISPYIVRKIGSSAARMLMLTSERFSAEKAMEYGLVHKVVVSGDLESAVRGFTIALDVAGPKALQRCKELLERVSEEPIKTVMNWTAEMIADLRTSEEGQEGMGAFLGKGTLPGCSHRKTMKPDLAMATQETSGTVLLSGPLRFCVRLFTAIFFLGVAIVSGVQPLYAVDDILLILPPVIHGEGCAPECNNPWNSTINVYRNDVLNTRPLPAKDILAIWKGDTLRVPLWSVDEAQKWDQIFEVDRVILSEWTCNGGTWTVSLQSVDPWSGSVNNPVEGESVVDAIRKMEGDRWIYGTEGDLPPSFVPPEPVGGPGAVQNYLHQKKTYPPDALIQGVSASANVRVIVSAKGVPVKVEKPRVFPGTWGFEPVIEQALWAIRYTPATVRGKPVNAVYETKIQISFRP